MRAKLAEDDPKKVRKCHAKSARSGKQCNRWALRGAYVCMTHGGSAPQVKRKAKERLADLIDPQRLLREIAAIAYLDVRELFDDEGKLLHVKKWPEHVARAIAGFEIIRGNRDAGDGKWDEVVKPRLWDKTKAMEMLAKHLNMFKEQIQLEGGIEVRWKGEE